MRHFARIATATVASAALAISLTGCTGGQSKLEACANLITSLADVTASLNESAENFQNDPVGSAQLVENAADKFGATVQQVTNEDVRSAAVAANEQIARLSDQYVEIAADPASANAEELTAAGDRTRKAMEDLQAACV